MRPSDDSRGVLTVRMPFSTTGASKGGYAAVTEDLSSSECATAVVKGIGIRCEAMGAVLAQFLSTRLETQLTLQQRWRSQERHVVSYWKGPVGGVLRTAVALVQLLYTYA
jgi:hypothetical protein